MENKTAAGEVGPAHPAVCDVISAKNSLSDNLDFASSLTYHRRSLPQTENPFAALVAQISSETNKHLLSRTNEIEPSANSSSAILGPLSWEHNMIRNLTLLCLFLATQTLSAEEPARAAPPESTDMRVIFNGKDLTGWDGDTKLWSVKDGVLRGETTAENPAKGNTFIILKDNVAKNFELRLSFRCSASNNSGIQYRSKHITEGKVGNPWVVRGYQHELRNEKKLPNVAGFIYDEGGKRGRICLVGEQAIWQPTGKEVVSSNLIDQAGFEKLFHLDDWNDVVIVAEGNHIQHYLNNSLILDFTDNDPKLALSEGIVALQLHAGQPMWVEFKNLRIKDLP